MSAVVVDTANRLQAREFDVVMVLHPLSDRASASEFHLESGRLCVLLSRHRQACIVVGGPASPTSSTPTPVTPPSGSAHPHLDQRTHIWIGAPIPVPDGWEANQIVLEHLLALRV